MTILCTIDLLTREVFLPADQRIAAYDHNVDVIHFQAEPVEDFSFDLSSIRIAAKGPNKARHDYPVDPSTVSIEEETGYITFDWPIPQGVTEMPEDMFGYGSTGQLIFAVCAEIIDGSTVSKAWHSDDGIITVVAHLEPEAGGGEDPEEEATNRQMIGQLQTDVAVMRTQIGAVAGGVPTVVDSISDMTDTGLIYILSSDSNWYYYNGSAWTAGGTYGGAVTDTTLSIGGAPADSKAVGDALADFTIEVDDTLTEQGKAADAKAVGDALSDADERLTALESGGSGMSSTAKALLISLLRKALYSSEQSADISALEVALETGDPVAVTGVSVSPTSGSIVYGESTLTIKATVTPSNATNKAVVWTSSDENVATVSVRGVVTAVSAGTATITATTMDGGFTATCTVTVTVENLIVESNITRGAYISRETGSANTSESFDATDYMWLKPNTTYYAEGPYMENFYAFYNSSKTFVTSPPSDVTVTYENDRNGRRSRKGTITTGANGYYFRASIDVDCHYTPYVSLVPLV